MTSAELRSNPVVITVFAIVALLILVLIVVTIGSILFRLSTRRRMKKLVSRAKLSSNRLEVAARFDALPEPAKRMIRFSCGAKIQIPKLVYLHQIGRIRKDVNSPWLEIEAQQVYSTNPPAFLWSMESPYDKTSTVLGRDFLIDGVGGMQISFLGTVPIVNKVGTVEMNQGAMLRYLNELVMWFPQALLGREIGWKEVRESSATVTFTELGRTVEGRIEVDPEGRLVNFVAKRYRSLDKGYELREWSTPVDEYGEFNGQKLPRRGHGVWSLDDAELTYIELTVDQIVHADTETDFIRKHFSNPEVKKIPGTGMRFPGSK